VVRIRLELTEEAISQGRKEMNKRRVLVIVLSLMTVLLLAVPSVVTANPRGKAAWKRYVDEKVAELYQYIDRQVAELHAYVDEKIAEIGGGGSGPDFSLPADEDWIVEAYAYSNPQGCYVPFLRVTTDVYGDDPTATCNWHGAALTPSFVGGSHYRSTGQAAAARAIASYNGEIVGYGAGGCGEILFQTQLLPQAGEMIDLDIWAFWMGDEESSAISRPVEEPPNSAPRMDYCWASPPEGSAPLTVSLNGNAEDDDPCEVLRFSVDFGDGTTAEDVTLPVPHTYVAPQTYEAVITTIDHGGLSTECRLPVDVW
jgi:hypothetical protein